MACTGVGLAAVFKWNINTPDPVMPDVRPLSRMSTRTTTIVLLCVLLLETLLVVSLRGLGWYGTGNAIQLLACIFVTLLPLLVASAMLLRNRLRFGLRAIFVATTLVAVFLMVSLMPMVKHREARQASMQLLSANATLHEGGGYDEFYSQIDLEPPPKISSVETGDVPPWLTSFTNHTSTIPTDNAIQSICLNNDEQCQILADNWERFPSLQSVNVTRGVSDNGFRLLQDVLPRFKNLDSVHTHDVLAPPNWYGSLTNIRMLWVWEEGASRGKPFPRDHLTDIAALSNLEVFMVLGYAFNNADASALAASTSIKRVILRGTAVTSAGESDLSNDATNRIVYRN